MITIKQAKKLRKGTTLYHQWRRNADDTPERWRVNGKVKTWKRDDTRVEVPLKRGLYSYATLYCGNLNQFCLTEREALNVVLPEDKL